MKAKVAVAIVFAVLCLAITTPSPGQERDDDFYRPWVDYRNGLVSVAFDQTPVDFALHAFQTRTGMKIVLPAGTENKVVNLRFQSQPLETAAQLFISTIGYQNFALMYDDSGRPNRAVVLETQPERAPSVALRRNEPDPAPMTIEEYDTLLRNLERWPELTAEERGRVEDRLKSLPASTERDRLVAEYGRRVLGLDHDVLAARR